MDNEATELLREVTKGTPMENVVPAEYGRPPVTDEGETQPLSALVPPEAGEEGEQAAEPAEEAKQPEAEEGEQIIKGLQLLDGKQVDVSTHEVAQVYHEYGLLQRENKTLEQIRSQTRQQYEQQLNQVSQKMVEHVKELAAVKQLLGADQPPDFSTVDVNNPDSLAAYGEKSRRFEALRQARSTVEKQFQDLASSNGQQNALSSGKWDDVRLKLPRVFPVMETEQGRSKVRAWLHEHGVDDAFTDKLDNPGMWELLGKAWSWDMALKGSNKKGGKGKQRVGIGRTGVGHAMHARAPQSAPRRSIGGEIVDPVRVTQMQFAGDFDGIADTRGQAAKLNAVKKYIAYGE